MRSRRLAMVGAALAVAAAALAGCGGPAAADSAGITVYNGQHEQTTRALVSAFERRTGIAVHVRSDDENTLANQIVAEGSRSPADVFMAANSPALQYLQSRKMLAKVDRSTLANTPSRFESATGRWVGTSARVSVVVYNTDLLKPSDLPTSIMQLADPRWRGKLALAPGETDFQPVVTAVDKRYGKSATVKWLEGLKANATDHVYPDNETITEEVNRGQAAIGVINQYYWYRLQVQLGSAGMHSAIAYFAPRDPGYVLNVSGAAVLASSTHKAQAQRFLAFVTSRKGQETIVHSDSFEYPVASGVTTPKLATPLSQLRPDPLSVSQLGTEATAIELLQEAQLL